MIISVSNGWLFSLGIDSFNDQKGFLLSSGADGIEISTDALHKRLDSIPHREVLSQFNLKTVHLHDFQKASFTLAQYISTAKKMKIIFDFIVVHPNGIPDQFWSMTSGLPIAIENMDALAKQGHEISQLSNLVKKHNLKFVLDVQHAYEHDSTMQYAKKLYKEIKDNLIYMHVSGQSKGQPHQLVHKAENKQVIIDFISYVLSEKKIPIIIEGCYKNQDELRTEIEFLRKIL